jgi:hypothetical protein
MRLFETSVTATAVRMRYADHPDPTKATQWVDFQVPIEAQPANPAADPGRTVGPELQLFGEVRLAALRHARAVIGEETRRLTELLDHRR